MPSSLFKSSSQSMALKPVGGEGGLLEIFQVLQKIYGLFVVIISRQIHAEITEQVVRQFLKNKYLWFRGQWLHHTKIT